MQLNWSNKQIPPLPITIPWLIVGFTLIIVFGSQLSWSSWFPPKFAIGFVLTILIAYLTVFLFSARLVSFPIRNPLLLFLLITISIYIVAIAVPAAFRFYYSRSFALLSLVLTLLWLVLGYLIVFRHQASKKIGLISDQYSEFLLTIPGYRWVLISIDNGPPSTDFDIIAADLHYPLSDDWKRFLADANISGTPIIHSAELYETLTGCVSLADISDVSIDNIATTHPNYAPYKRILDIFVVALFSPLLILLMTVIAVAIRIENTGPTLFVQERTGFRNRPFRLYKFRSMESKTETAAPQFAQSDDQRVTRVGRFLRKHRLDELPQLINVATGSMSLIGPRPEQPDFAQQYARTIPFYAYRHSVRPGITGWAQVSHGYTSSEESTRKKLEHDFYYIKNVSPWLDFLIVLKTFNTILGGYGSRY